MPSAQCIKNVTSQPPPDNRMCTDAWCAKLQSGINGHCEKKGLPPDAPVSSLDPDVGYCYCCCSCFAYDTPIEKSPGEFVLVQDIEAGETILAAGEDLVWVPTAVEYSTGWESSVPIPGMYLVRYDYPTGEEDWRDIVVTADHLFLMESGQLKPVQKIAPGDKLRRADKGVATVHFVAVGAVTNGVHSLQMGEFDGKNLKGHLINSNGVVSADYAVQVHYATNNIKAALLVKDEERTPEVGTRDYAKSHDCRRLDAFLADKSAWPKGFTPQRGSEINIPPHAKSYLTEAQAGDVRSNGTFGSKTNTFPAQALLYLYKISRAFYPDVTLLLDWENDLPNAYSWKEWDQRMVVFTGGLVRLQGMNRDGLSLILSTQLAYQDAGVNCVGEADYDGVSYGMRDVWSSNLFFRVIENAVPEIEQLFSYVSPENARENPDDICAQPSLQCRLETYQAAISLGSLPDCAKPAPEYFGLSEAIMETETTIAVIYNRPVNPPTAQTVANYTLAPAAKINKARVDPGNPARVALTVRGLKPGTPYTLTVANVVSADGKLIDPKHSQVEVAIPK